MSDEEEYSEEEEEEDAPEPQPDPEPEQDDPSENRDSSPAPAAKSGPTEAELAMQKRRDEMTHGSNEDYSDVLEQGKLERDAMEEEIQLLRERREQRKKERVREEKEIQAKRQEEEASRKQEEVERKRQKEEAENERKSKRDDQMKEFAKMQDTKANFVIIKKSNELVGGPQEDDKEEGESNKMSREQELQERKAILGQRIVPLEIEGFDEAKLKSKAESLHGLILRLEGEKYDLEKRFREQQQDMLEMAERARNINKVGKTGLKRVVLKDDERDTIQERFSGAPSKIELYSRFERQPDKRVYDEKHTVFVGPTYLFPADKITPTKLIKWDENSGLPTYTGLDGKELVEADEE